jgi:hypothetical protein
MHTFLGRFFLVVGICIGRRLFYRSYAGRIHFDPDIERFYSRPLTMGMPFTQLYNRPDENEGDDTKSNILHYCRIHRTNPFQYMRTFTILILAIPEKVVK